MPSQIPFFPPERFDDSVTACDLRCRLSLIVTPLILTSNYLFRWKCGMYFIIFGSAWSSESTSRDGSCSISLIHEWVYIFLLMTVKAKPQAYPAVTHFRICWLGFLCFILYFLHQVSRAGEMFAVLDLGWKCTISDSWKSVIVCTLYCQHVRYLTLRGETFVFPIVYVFYCQWFYRCYDRPCKLNSHIQSS